MTKSKIILISLLVLILTSRAISISSFLWNQAPITQGKIIYGKEYKKGLKLDIYPPTNKENNRSPLLIFIHGGAWLAGSKETMNFNRINKAINDLRNNGFIVVSPNYTLAKNGKSPFPRCIIDIHDAINWMIENSNKYNIDTNNIGIIGESAGAHIGMMISFLDNKNGLIQKDYNIKYMVSMYGPSDLELLYQQETVKKVDSIIDKLPDPIQEKIDIKKNLLGFDPEKDTLRTRKFLRAFSPVNFIDSLDPHILAIHGTFDRVVDFEQHINLIQKLEKLNVPHDELILDSTDHAFIGISNDQKELLQEKISTWILDQKYSISNSPSKTSSKPK